MLCADTAQSVLNIHEQLQFNFGKKNCLLVSRVPQRYLAFVWKCVCMPTTLTAHASL